MQNETILRFDITSGFAVLKRVMSERASRLDKITDNLTFITMVLLPE